MEKKLYRSRTNQVISGVCAGIADYFDIDPTIVRIIFALSLFSWGTGLLIYIVCIFIIPENPEVLPHDDFAYNVSTEDELRKTKKTKYLLGIIMIIFGGISILDRLHWIDFDLLWPVAIIAIGLFIILKENK